MILFASACGALALLVLAIILLPLLRRTQGPADAGQFDRAVYRDQLAELEQDVARGLIPADAAAPARVQIERRLLDTAPKAAPPPTARRSPILAVVACIALLIAPAYLYWRLGTPGLPDQPFATRVIARAAKPGQGHTDLEKSAIALAAKLKEEPNNAERWLLYARTTAALSQWHKSMEAYGEVLRLEPGDPMVWAGFGEMQVMSAEGIITPGARDAFTKAVTMNPKILVARFYLAMGDAQAGELTKAIDAWQKLAADVPEGSDMREEIVRRVADASKMAGIPVPALPAGPPMPPAPAEAAAEPGGPDAAAMAAAAAMPVEQREKLIRDMVGKLADKQAKNPNDTDGWLKLGRAYLVLQDPAKAADAYAKAHALNPNDPAIALQQAMAEVDTLPEATPVPDKTVQLLKQVQAADPAKPEVYWYLGIAAARNRDRAEAQRLWQHLLTMLPPAGEDHKNVQSALDSLR